MNPQIIEPKNLEHAAHEMRELIKTAQRKLLEFEALMSAQEIKEGKSETFETADDLVASVS